MTAGQLAGLFTVWVIAVMSPGPDLVVVLQRSLAGRRQGLLTAVGVVLGITLWLIAAVAGLAAVIRVYPQVMVVLQILGGLLLGGLGAIGLRAWWRGHGGAPASAVSSSTPGSDAAPTPGPEPASVPVSASGADEASSRSQSQSQSQSQSRPRSRSRSLSRSGLRPGGDVARGLATNLANPKAVVFFGAVLTPFLGPGFSAGTAVPAMTGMVAIALAWFTGLALAASHPGVRRRLDRVLPWVDPAVSALFVAVGVAFVIGAAVSAGGG